MTALNAIPAPKVIGPYSRWPRRTRRTDWRIPMTVAASAATAGVFVHCAVPVLF